VLLAGIDRLISMRKVGLPQPAGVWLGYLIPELLIPFIMAGAHYAGA
jgi:predicted DNA repair protein MutK